MRPHALAVAAALVLAAPACADEPDALLTIPAPGLITAPDGSVTILVQHAAPQQAANRLPTPQGPFYLVLRLYQPRAAVLDGTYLLPDVIRSGA